MWTRRKVFKTWLGAPLLAGPVRVNGQTLRPEGENMTFGWNTGGLAERWDLDMLLEIAKEAGVHGVELGAGHGHGVALTLSPEARDEVRSKFEQAGLELIGMSVPAILEGGSPEALMTAADMVKQHVRLSHDAGGSGVRLRLGSFKGGDAGVRDKVAGVLRDLGDFAVGFGQELRLEADVGSGELAEVAGVLKAVDSAEVRAALRVDDAGVSAELLKKTFEQLSDGLGQTVVFDVKQEGGASVYDALAACLVGTDYAGWTVLAVQGMEAIEAVAKEKVLWERRVREARKS